MSGWTCVSCGKQSPEGTRFCGFCGTPAAAAPSVATWSCRMCGTANPEGNAFCGGCGERQQAARTEELRLVTALFADVSGFTTLADTLDVESLHEVITPLVRGLTQIAERYEGFIEKFAGDALLVLYGAPVTHEDDAQRALLAALDMHAELPRLLAEIGPHAANLTIHVGVNTGRVIGRQVGSVQQSDYAVLGDSVILAQRLESACPSGETYVGPKTYELCKDEFEFESVGELTLKGKTKPVEAFRLLGRREAGAAAGTAFVGRHREVEQAEGGLASAQVTTLAGDPGAGKSRLMAELRRRTTESGGVWLAARCLSYGASLAYWPLTDLFRQELRVRPEASPDELARAIAETVPPEALAGTRRLLGVDSGGDPETARREVHEAVRAWLLARARNGRTVLALEDVHWADRSTVDLLAELARDPALPVSVLLTSRPEGRTLAEKIAGDGEHVVVELAPLEQTGIAELSASILAGAAARPLVELLASRTGGNALHVAELVRSLAESDALVRTVEGWDLRPTWNLSAIPTSIERIFATRLDTLAPSAAALLQLASVVGRTARLSLLVAVNDSPDFDSALASLIQTGMLLETHDSADHAVTFSHSLLQDVVYSRLLRKRRRELHRRVAEAARSLYGEGDDSIGLLARHLFLADAAEEAVEPLLRAARHAAGLYANDEAVVHFERAVEVLEAVGALDDERLRGARLQLADLHLLRGDYDASVALFRTAADTGDPRGWAGLLAALHASGDYPGVLEAFSAALDTVAPQSSSATPLWLRCGTTLMSMGRYGDAVSTFKTGLRLAADTDIGLRGRLLAELAHCETQLNRHSDALEHAEDAVTLLEAADDARALLVALRVAGAARMYASLPDLAREALTRGIEVAHRTGALFEAAGCLVNLGMLSMEQGKHDVAMEEFRQALALLERLGHAQGQAVAAGNLADALARRGDLDEAETAAARALALGRQLGHGTTIADVTRTLARIALARGDHATAARLGDEAAHLFLDLEAPDDVAECERLATQARKPTAG